jgi:PAT family beta-lactamase induction signal transducer AmpG
MTLRRKLGWVAALYFAEGMPFAIVKDVLPVYFRVQGLSLTEVGLTQLLGMPWTLKVLWSPLIDRFGERRQWMAACLAAMCLLLILIPAFDPGSLSLGLWAALLLFTVASATQDIAIDAYTIGLIEKGEEGEANGVRVSAYRAALIIAGGGLLLLAGVTGWGNAFLTAAVLFAGLALILSRAPRIVVPIAERRRWLEPMKEWLFRPGAVSVLLFVLIYKLGDAAMGPMPKALWLARGLGESEIGLVATSAGVLATIAGALLGGHLTTRWGIFHGLWILGLTQALSNLGYAVVAWMDLPEPATTVSSLSEAIAALGEPARAMLYGASIFESFTGGLGTAAFLAFLMHVCDKRHAAVQYALLSAVFAFSRDVAGATSGWATTRLGYGSFFFLTFLLALPAYGLLPFIRGWIRDRDQERVSDER